MGKPRYYPAFLDIAKFPSVVIGGGAVASRKVEMLLQFGADVTVIAPACVAELRNLAGMGAIRLIEKAYEDGDLDGFRLAVVATDCREVNQRAFDAAEARGMLVNVVDKPALCNFIVPSMIQRGNLLIAISTGGKSPALAKWLRIRLEQEIGPEYERHLDFLGELRETYVTRIGVEAVRSEGFMAVIESDCFRLLDEGDEDAAWAEAIRILQPFVEKQCD